MFSHTKGTIDNGDTGDVACDSYHKFREDVQLLRDMQVNECLCLILYGREKNYCLKSTEASRPNKDGDERENGERRVKPRNWRQPGRPRLPWTAARTTDC